MELDVKSECFHLVVGNNSSDGDSNCCCLTMCITDVDSSCSEFDGGTPLHIAAQNLALETARVLLANGAYPFAVDRNGKLPLGKSYFEPRNAHFYLHNARVECNV